MEKINIIVCEDHELFRKSLISLLNKFKEFEVVGEAGNGRELLDILKGQSTDIVLMDYQMPVMNGLEALEIINKRFTGIKVIMLSFYTDALLVYDFMICGARGYLPKATKVQTVIECIKTVKKHGYYFCNETSRSVLSGSMKRAGINPLRNQKSLSEREVEVMIKLCAGLSNKEIAYTLNITPRTVEFHRGNIYEKTGSGNFAQLMKYAIRNGFVNVNDLVEE